MTEQERRIAAKIPGEDTGIEVKKTMCDICSPGLQCGVDAYVREGKIIKLEGTEGFPVNFGKLCTKGASGRQYMYREDRIRTPLQRVGPRGSGEYRPISWDEALDICARELQKQRERDPDGVVWLTGYSKWYRPFLHRLAHSFGTKNYLTESSACHEAEVMSYMTVYGEPMMPSPAGAGTVIAWAVNATVNTYPLGQALMGVRERGGKVVVIDPRVTPTAQQAADLHLRPRVGTDGFLAAAMADWIIRHDRQDRDFIEKYVYGYEEFRDYVSGFSLERAERVTGVKASDIERVADMLSADPTGVILPGNSLTHRRHGFNNHRMIISLMALLGRVGGKGGLCPASDTFAESNGGVPGHQEEFINDVLPRNAKPPVGHLRFPLWAEMVDQGQAMDLIRQMETADPYPVRAMACFGVNARMYPESDRLLRAMDGLDFSFATDLFMTDVCRHADIVLPVCTSYERGEVKCYGGRFVNYTQPAVEPLYESRPDTEIIFELARRMNLGDELLEAGYDACIEFIFRGSGIEDWEAVKASPMPVPVPHAKGYVPGSYFEDIKTPSGRIELVSRRIGKYANLGLEPLPVLREPELDERYPMTLIAGARLPHSIHSRLHGVPWARSLRPVPAADISPEDAAALGIRQNDTIVLETATNRITVAANITVQANRGEVIMVHGYPEANVNSLISMEELDPYTGFPNYKQTHCVIRKA